jgi:D-lactate dehydrogenase (cytochrome)
MKPNKPDNSNNLDNLNNLDNKIQPLQDCHNDYLRDESRTSGKAETISFPKNEAEIQAIVKSLINKKTPITIQGSRTGITGGAVPVQGHILNLSKMTRTMGLEMDENNHFSIRVQPGISLLELGQQIYTRHFDIDGWDKNSLDVLEAITKTDRLFWPPDPSEDSASIGGIAANNSRGICAHHYGSARNHIKGIQVVDTRGEIHSITRQDQSDLMDLYLGSEGMLGVITELTLSLQPLPREIWGIVFFFGAQSQALDFIQAIKENKKDQIPEKKNQKKESNIVAIEFMDQITLECIREFKQTSSQLKELPGWNTSLTSAVYLEIHGNDAEEIEELSLGLLETAVQWGNDPDNTWAFCGQDEIDRLRLFRHAAPESINHFLDKARQKDFRITKLGTDMGLENTSLSELIEMYHKGLKVHGLKAAIFGHAGDGHLHVNILPKDYQQFEKGKILIKDWAKIIHTKGGSVVTEHGIGKIKKDLFQSIPLPQQQKIISSVKQKLDPNGLWNPGNMVDSQKQ